MSRIRPWKSKRDTLTDNKRALDFLADMSGQPRHEFATRIPPPPKKRVKSDAISEADVNADIRKWCREQPDITLYRNNQGSVPLEGGGRLTYGVGPTGAADWIGYKTVVITPAMVGKKIAVFTAVEAKRPGAKARVEQVDFLLGVARAGGISGVASSKDELEIILGD